MTSTLSQVAAVIAGLAILATAFILPATSRGLRNGLAAAVVLAITAAVLMTVVRQFG